MLIFSLIASIFICFGIPIIGIIILKKKKYAVFIPFLAGALAFFISQICIRIPVLGLLQQTAWYNLLQYQPVAYALFLGVTAGIMEEGARWIFMKLFLRREEKQEIVHGVAFGLGHGGIEAVLLVGINLLYVLFIEISGGGDLGVTSAAVLLGGVERIFAIAFHVGASLIVLYGIRRHKAGRYLLLAVLLHTLMDAATVILQRVFSVGAMGIEIFVAIFAGITLAIGICLFRESK